MPPRVRSRRRAAGGVRVAEADGAAARPGAGTVTRASVPRATAQVEAFELTETGDGTHVRWTLALEPRLLGRVSAPLAARTIPRLFRRAMDNLGTYVHGAR